MTPAEMAANAAAEAEARADDADLRLIATDVAVANLRCLYAATYATGDSGAIARAELDALTSRIASVCSRYHEHASGEARAWDTAVREARRADEAEQRAQRAEERAEKARSFVDFLLTVDPERIDRAFVVESLSQFREQRENET